MAAGGTPDRWPPDRRHRDPGRQDRACLELSIRASRSAAFAGSATLLVCALQAWLLQRQGALLPSAMVALGGALLGWGLWQLLGSGVPRKMRLYPDGRALFFAEGNIEETWLAPGSLRLGTHVLLVFRRPGRRLRLLLGPGIVSADAYAALGRWLQRAPRGEGSGAGLLR
jgi:hypothetical protein